MLKSTRLYVTMSWSSGLALWGRQVITWTNDNNTPRRQITPPKQVNSIMWHGITGMKFVYGTIPGRHLHTIHTFITSELVTALYWGTGVGFHFRVAVYIHRYMALYAPVIHIRWMLQRRSSDEYIPLASCMGAGQLYILHAILYAFESAKTKVVTKRSCLNCKWHGIYKVTVDTTDG